MPEEVRYGDGRKLAPALALAPVVCIVIFYALQPRFNRATELKNFVWARSETVLPRIIDHEQRRREIAAIVENILYEHGTEALTIRDVAERAGCSTTIVSHYFRTKLEMLVFTNQAARGRGEGLLATAVKTQASILQTMNSLLPTNEAMKTAWHTCVAFWGMTPQDARVTAEWYEGVSEAHSLFEDLVRIGQQAGEVDPSLKIEQAANMLQVIINGISSLWAKDRKHWTAARQRKLLQEMLESTGFCKKP